MGFSIEADSLPGMKSVRRPGMKKNMDLTRPLAIDLFAGVGGLSLGFEQAGFEVVAAVEIDPVHCAAHQYNFPDCAVLPRSVVGLTAAEIRLAAGIGDRPVDCVFGGPPCQGFSMIGHRVLDDPRNGLVREFVRIVRDLGANSFVFENVKGLTVGRHREFLHELIQAFDEAGYQITSPWQVLNAVNFGVPQSRERLILIGVKKGLPAASYPEPMTRASGGRGNSHLPFGPSCRDALEDLPDADQYQTLLKSDSVKTRRFGSPSTYAAELRCIDGQGWHFGHVREWSDELLTSSARTMHSEISKARFAETPQGYVEPISRFLKLNPNGVCNTLRAGTDGARGAFTSPRPIHYKHDRCITVREMARLHGYPDWFRFNVTKWHGARQIGNSVPPPLGRAIATKVIEALGVVPVQPAGVQQLGPERLLSFDVSTASAHYGIEAPSSRRTMKSGSRKRKQHEIEAERAILRLANA